MKYVRLGKFETNVNEVSRLLNGRYGSKYRVFNLTYEAYDYKKFNNQVKVFIIPNSEAW